MLCSRCSTPVRPAVAIDIDGTLGDYHGHFIAFAEAWMGRGRLLSTNPEGWKTYDGTEPFRDWFQEAYDVDVTTFRTIKLAYRQGGLKRTMQPLLGAWDLLNGLTKQRVEVWLTTTRPWERFDRVDPDTVHWLNRQRFPYHGLIFDENKLDELAARVAPGRVVAVLDDQPEVLQRAEELGWPPVKIASPYNRGWQYPVEAAGLNEAYQMITTHVEAWQRRNG